MARVAEHHGAPRAEAAPGASTDTGPFTPAPYRVEQRARLTDDVVSLGLRPLEGERLGYLPGQFTMLTAFGIGEVPISVSGDPERDELLVHTVRDVGPVTHALCTSEPGSILGVRGPFGTDWGAARLVGSTVVVVAGGIGLAPLRGAVCELTRAVAAGRGRLAVVVGARSPDQIVFADDLRAWAAAGADVTVTVDVAQPGWRGHVGLVTSLLPYLPFELHGAHALVCGPEVMMRFAVRALVEGGMASAHVQVSLERNMQCGVGLCGHCQLGPYLLCRDGPVLPYAGLLPSILLERER